VKKNAAELQVSVKTNWAYVQLNLGNEGLGIMQRKEEEEKKVGCKRR